MRHVTTLRHGPAARTVALVAVAALLAGCRGDGDPTDDGVDAAAPADDDGDVDGTEPADDGDDDGADDDAADDGAAAPEPVVVDLDFEERVADGTTFRVSRLEVTDLSVLVDVEIIVAADTSYISLNNILSTPAVIVDDLGNEYPVIAPDDNDALIIDGGERLEGTLAYQGPLRRGVSTLQLLFNQDSDPDGTRQTDRQYPHFTFPPVDITAGS